MPINFVFRNLTGSYRGSTANAINDYVKVSNMFLEIAKDLTSIDSRIKALEATTVTIITNNNFTANSINGTVIASGTMPGTALQNNSITGDQIVINSVHGLVDANIATGANINPSKIDLGNLSHTQIKDIGSNTHPQIDTFIDLTNAAIISTNNDITAINTTLGVLNSDLSILNAYVDPQGLSTIAQTVAPAINELFAGLQSVGASGTVISGPGSPTFHSIARWGASNISLLDSLVLIDNANSITIPGDIKFTSNSSFIGDSANAALQLYTSQVHSPAGSDLTMEADGSIFINANGAPTSNIYATSLGAAYITSSGANLLNYTGTGIQVDPFSNVRVINYIGNRFEVESDNVGLRVQASGSLIKLTTAGEADISATGGQISLYSPSGVIDIVGSSGYLEAGTTVDGNLIISAYGAGALTLNSPADITMNAPTGLHWSDGALDSLDITPLGSQFTSTNDLTLNIPTVVTPDLVPLASGTQSIGYRTGGIHVPYASGNIDAIRSKGVHIIGGNSFAEGPQLLVSGAAGGWFPQVEIDLPQSGEMFITSMDVLNQGSLVLNNVQAAFNGLQHYNNNALGDADSGAILTIGGTLCVLQYRLSATSPTVTDDASQGFTIFSRWIDTVGQAEYVCIDPTNGAALWKKTTP